MLGIVSFGVENFFVLRRLRGQGIPTFTILDDLTGPLDDMPLDHAKNLVLSRCAWLRNQGCTQIVVSPFREIFLRHQGYNDIVSLFTHYVQTVCFHHSLVGKLGRVMTRLDMLLREEITSLLVKQYTLTDAQEKTKNFLFPFAHRPLIVPVWQTMIRELSSRQFLINHVVKTDLRPLKDAGVDTIILSQRSFFSYQRTISRFFTNRIYHFFDDRVIRPLLLSLIVSYHDTKHCHHRVVYTGTGSLLTIPQRHWLIQMGDGNVDIDHVSID